MDLTCQQDEPGVNFHNWYVSRSDATLLAYQNLNVESLSLKKIGGVFE